MVESRPSSRPDESGHHGGDGTARPFISFDLGDGLLRNEHASHLFHDPENGEWRGWTTGFSAYGGDGGEDEKTILAVSSTRDPRRGFSIMKAKPVGIDGAHEDPHGIYDSEARKWRLLLCEKHEKFSHAEAAEYSEKNQPL